MRCQRELAWHLDSAPPQLTDSNRSVFKYLNAGQGKGGVGPGCGDTGYCVLASGCWEGVPGENKNYFPFLKQMSKNVIFVH